MAKKGFKFCQKYKIPILVKNVAFFFGFSIVIQPNQGVQQKYDCFEQLSTNVINPYHFKEHLFLDPFSHFL